MKDIFNLSDKVVVLTGGLGQIGLNYIGALLSKKAKVVVLDVKSEREAENILKNKFLLKQRDNILYCLTDITKKIEINKTKKIIISRYNKIDVLINNAAMVPKVDKDKFIQSNSVTFEDLDVKLWNKEFEINLTAMMMCCQEFGSIMKSGSSIINISSIYGVVAPDQGIYQEGFIKPATYGVTKAGVINLTKYLATYWGKKNIRVNSVVLGGVYANQDTFFLKRYADKTPLGRMANPDEFNGIIVYLSSDASSYATGSVFTIDGGWTAW